VTKADFTDNQCDQRMLLEKNYGTLPYKNDIGTKPFKNYFGKKVSKL
jgi:hypothetical protein